MSKQKPSKTNAKHRKFASEYVIDENGTRAYKAAAGREVSDGAAAVGASRWLKNPKVIALIEEAREQMAKRNEVDQNRVISTILRTIDRSEGLHVVLDKKGKPQIIELPEPITVTGIDENGRTVTITTTQAGAMCDYNPFAVLKGSELLAKHLKMFTDKIEFEDKTKDMKAARMAVLLKKAGVKIPEPERAPSLIIGSSKAPGRIM